MFDLRYHVASLAAVFFALVVGILVGVALASHGLGSAERRKLQDELKNANNRIDKLNGTVQESKNDSAFVAGAYNAVMSDRLRDENVGLLFIGRFDKSMWGAVRKTLDDTGATMTRMRAVSVVGTEFRGTFPSAVSTYKHYGLSSVDDVDIPIGKVALAVLLSPDGANGHYGLQEVDDAVLPDISPVTAAKNAGG